MILFDRVKFYLNDVREILQAVREKNLTVDEALLKLREKPFEDIGFAKVDLHRKIRRGTCEVIYGAGKTPEQIAGIVNIMLENDQDNILITRLQNDSAIKLQELGINFKYYDNAKIAVVGNIPEPKYSGKILIATGGTSDIPVAEEAALTAEVFGNRVNRLYDVGVAGLHRVLSHIDEIMTANVIIAVAGMEGALASVLGGLSNCPVIAVPTSVGYGASFGGVSALLAMLNSCASGVSVVNIDNGFGAGYLAGMINRNINSNKNSGGEK